jgi:hypothetical protein
VNVFFDVDDTLIAYDGSLRPLVRETFERIKLDGHQIYVWSGVGVRWDVVDQHGLRPWVTDCFEKPVNEHRARLVLLGISPWPDFVVDDHPQMVAAFNGHRVRDYFWPDLRDREMEIVYQKIVAFSLETARLNGEAPV